MGQYLLDSYEYKRRSDNYWAEEWSGFIIECGKKERTVSTILTVSEGSCLLDLAIGSTISQLIRSGSKYLYGKVICRI